MKKIISLCFFILTTISLFTVSLADEFYVGYSSGNGQFSEGLKATVDENTGRIGWVDKSFNWVISPIYDSVTDFNNGIALAKTPDNEYYFVNHGGEQITKVDEYLFEKINFNSSTVIKHGNYYICCDENDCILLDSEYKELLPGKVLETISQNPWSFFENDDTLYNYKGENISKKIYNENEGILPENSTVQATDTHLLLYDSENKRPVIFDVDGNRISNFKINTYEPDYNDRMYLYDSLVVLNQSDEQDKTCVYDFYGNLIVELNFDANIVEYYNKYFVVQKNDATAALYKNNGDIVVDYGKWDNIIPAQFTDKLVVQVNRKYGIADYNGNIHVPLKYYFYKIENNIASFENDNAYYLYNLSTMASTFSYGGFSTHSSKVVIQSEDNAPGKIHSPHKILNNNFEEVYSDLECVGYAGFRIDENNEGIYRFYQDETDLDKYIFFEDNGGVKVKLNNRQLTFDQQPIILNDRTLVPVRAIFEALGANVVWDDSSQTVISNKNEIEIKLTIGSNVMTINGKEKVLDVSPQIISGRTLVPVRAIAESFDVDVDYNVYNQTVLLCSK